MSHPSWSLSTSWQKHISFPTTLQGNMWFSTTLSPCEQLIEQQMVQLQDSILERLHHHTFSSMFSDETFEVHHAWILSCFGIRTGVWFTTRPIFPTFQLSSLDFCTIVHTWLRLPHPLIAGILWCVCTHPINPLSIHLLHFVHGNEHTRTHDAICDTFATIAQDVGFHLGQK